MEKPPPSLELLRHELEKDYYSENYLDKFESELPEKINVSAIIPTFNRVPYNPNKEEINLNPLYWCLTSLLNQKPKLNEIIVINDNSNDFTNRLVLKFKKMQKSKDIKIILIKNKKRVGSSISRNIGVKKASSDFIFFMDDDCIAKKYSVFGAYYTFVKFSEEQIKVGAIHLSSYTRINYPFKIARIDNIGKINLEKGIWTGNHDCFPEKYLQNNGNYFFDDDYKILRPIQIQNLGGCFLTSKKRFMTTKGFPDFFFWKNSYGEETELACRFMENGYSLFFSPDPKFGLYHGRFGDSKKIFVNKKDFKKHKDDFLIENLKLEKINKECSNHKDNTGNRIDIEDWYYSKIISFFIIFYKRNRNGALNWVKNVKKFFVEDNIRKFGISKWMNLEDKEKREEIWYNAIIEGLELVTKKTKDEIWDFLKELEKIRKFEFKYSLHFFD